MKITKKQFQIIEEYFPVQRGNVKTNNYDFINAILYIAETGCKWRELPKEYGKWNSIYKRFNRLANNGTIQKVFTALQQERIIIIKIELVSFDSYSSVQRDGYVTKNLKENNQTKTSYIGKMPSIIWYPQITKRSVQTTDLDNTFQVTTE